ERHDLVDTAGFLRGAAAAAAERCTARDGGRGLEPRGRALPLLDRRGGLNGIGCKAGRLAALGALVTLTHSPAWAADAKPPKETDISYYYDIFEQSVVRPATRMLDPSLWVRKVTGTRHEAENVDANDEVRLPSTWWQPRAGFRTVTTEQMLRGPGTGAGPAPGKWTVTRAKTQGVTPGFFIKDSQGTRYIVKFD